MSAHDPNPGWLDQARTLLDDSAAGLDAATLSRLNRARQGALAQRRRTAPRRWMLPAGLASACLALFVALAWHALLPSGALQELPINSRNVANADMDLVSSDDSLEMYQDLEFYAWLEAQDQDLGS